MPKKNELEENVKVIENKTAKSTKKNTEAKKQTKKITSTTSTKTSSKKETAKKTTKKADKAPKATTSKKSTTKKADSTAKKTSTKKTTVKKGIEVKAEKPKETVVKRKIEKLENLESKEKQVKEKIDEASVIEKIKNFLSKIIAMQEEDAEDVDKKVKEKKTAVKKEKSVTPEYLLEYYDLPYRYNETVVKILAQTPKRLFVYWDISDKDREKYVRTFGEDFFYKTYPVLLLYNEDRKYIKEIPINDFANSWYIDIQDPKNKYTIQLGRKFKGTPEVINMAAFEEEKIILRTDYLPFADSNKLEVPNDHVLLELLPRFITFRNVKTNQETVRDLRSFKDIFGTTYNVKEFYQEHYEKELSEEGMFDMANPSSAPSSSSFK